jgi:uncharacterized membrane protein (GlpM family)
MQTSQIIGWKSYAVGAVCIIIGMAALTRGYWGDGLKGILGGLALITLRDAIAKILRAIEDNRRAMDNLRAVADTLHSKSNSR